MVVPQYGGKWAGRVTGFLDKGRCATSVLLLLIRELNLLGLIRAFTRL
jgi:hypothetical protein